jgi:hypothetical protein
MGIVVAMFPLSCFQTRFTRRNNCCPAKRETLSRLARVSGLIEGYETPHGVELLSTVHWVAVHEDRKAMIDPKATTGGFPGTSTSEERLLRTDRGSLATSEDGEVVLGDASHSRVIKRCLFAKLNKIGPTANSCSPGTRHSTWSCSACRSAVPSLPRVKADSAPCAAPRCE